jgi:hypothetical protein
MIWRPGPKLYGELASWWPLLSSPADYQEEAAFYRKRLIDACAVRHSELEPGSYELFVCTKPSAVKKK